MPSPQAAAVDLHVVAEMLDVHGIAAIAVAESGPMWANPTAEGLVREPDEGRVDDLRERLERALTLAEPVPRLAPGERGTIGVRFAANHELLEREAACLGGEGRVVLISFAPRAPEDPEGHLGHVERLEAMLESTSDIITVLDADGRIRYSNSAAGRITGLAGFEANGESFATLVHPDDIDVATDAFVRGVVAGEAAPSVDIRLRFADGLWHNVEAEIMPTPIVVEGTPCHVVTVRDVTERVRRTTELEAARRRLELIVEHLDDVIVVLNRDLSVQWASPGIERLVDAPAYTNVGENAFNDMHEADVANVLATLEEVMAEPGRRGQVLLRLHHERDGWRWVDASVVNRLEDDAIGGLVCTLRDVTGEHDVDTELRRSRERDREEMVRLREAERVKDTFLAALSHEMRTPLTAVIGFASILERNAAGLGEDERRLLLERISANAKEMRDMVEHLLDFSQLQAGRAQIELVAIDIDTAVTELVDRLALQLEHHEVEICRSGVAALGDRRAFDHVLRNLLTNAARYSGQGTTITVESVQTGDEVAVRVTDQGIGIAPQEQAKVFQSFYQVAPAAAGRRGTGVGLNVARRYAQLQHGRLTIESALGEGSTFSLFLPVALQ